MKKKLYRIKRFHRNDARFLIKDLIGAVGTFEPTKVGNRVPFYRSGWFIEDVSFTNKINTIYKTSISRIFCYGIQLQEIK